MSDTPNTDTDTPFDIDWDVIEAKRAKHFNQGRDASSDLLYRQKHKHIAKENGVEVGDSEHLYLETKLYSSKRGLIRSSEPDYKKKLEQWEKASEGL